MENKRKLLLEVRHLDVQFNVRGRVLNAIRDISLEIYDGESIAIVGESGSGKSVFTKTFAGMLDSNGVIAHGKIKFYDEELSKTVAPNTKHNKRIEALFFKKLNEFTLLELTSDYYYKIQGLEEEYLKATKITKQEKEKYDARLKQIDDQLNEDTNTLQVLNFRVKEDREKIYEYRQKVKSLKKEKSDIYREIKIIESEKKKTAHENGLDTKTKNEIQALKLERKQKIEELKTQDLSEELLKRNDLRAKEVVLAICRFNYKIQFKLIRGLLRDFKDFMNRGKDINNPKQLDKIYFRNTFRVEYKSTNEDGSYDGWTVVDCARVKFSRDRQKIRGCKIATVFQDPMTSLNPILTIGKQITSVILKHQRCSASEAKERAIDIMRKVGIPDPEHRFYDYPFQYSGGMRQRIVIAIALSCQPKILICDEPTTALDVTIQAQIIKLIRDLSKELGFTTVYITHDLGVVANVAERVAVLYGGQIVELGTVEEIFYDPKHPYTWALLSSLPQLSKRQTDLFSIPGTPPSLYNKIVGDAFAPRSAYAMAIDYVKEPPMFKVSETHFAKTWLLDPRAPKIEKPELITNLHEKMCEIYKNVNIAKEGENNE